MNFMKISREKKCVCVRFPSLVVKTRLRATFRGHTVKEEFVFKSAMIYPAASAHLDMREMGAAKKT